MASAVPLDQFDAAFAGLVELSSEALGGSIVACSDEFFAPAADLLRVPPARSMKGQFGPDGALFDGWETRRHNKSNDWAIVKLGAPGRCYGFDVDTANFNGNEAPGTMIKALYAEDVPSPEDSRWYTVLTPTPLGPSSRHLFQLDTPTQPITHLMLFMLPDGGIARFRVYGEVVPSAAIESDAPFDMASILNGGTVVWLSDQHFGTGSNLILPGRGVNMGDGWETKRSRQPGHHDCVIFKLATPGFLDWTEIDTNHFIGNYPDTCELHGTTSDQRIPASDATWLPLLPKTKLGPHLQHYFPLQATEQPISHVKLTIWPDGGIKRIRLFGRRAGSKASPSPVPASAPVPTSAQSLATPHVSSTSIPRIPALPLSHPAFAPFGHIIEAASDSRSTLAPTRGGPRTTSVNFGTATKHNFLAPVTALDPHATAPVNLCIFVSQRQAFGGGAVFEAKAMERHAYTSQTFVPMGGTASQGRYLVLVAGNGADDRPDFGTLRAFVARPEQGISYLPGVWHHPLIAYNADINFLCVVHETGDKAVDCELLTYGDDVKAVVYEAVTL